MVKMGSYAHGHHGLPSLRKKLIMHITADYSVQSVKSAQKSEEKK